MAKIALVICFLCISLNVAFGQDYVSGLLTYQRNDGGQSNNTVQGDDPATCLIGDQQTCKDCKTLMICDGQGTELGDVGCEGSNPYCSGTSCTSVFPTGCTENVPDFTCTSDGYMPDPTTCLKYYYCKDGTVDKAYDCPNGYYADTTTFVCKRAVYSSNCVTISCKDVTKPTILVHPTNKSFYVFCDTATSTAIMFSCGKGYQFNSETKRCEYKCTGEGNFPGKTDEQYVFCYKSGGTYKYIEEDCPSGVKYNTTKRACA